jgi:hypothetical protein
MEYDVFRLFPTPIIKFKFKYHERYFFENIEKKVNIPEDWLKPLNTSFPNVKDDDDFINIEKREHLKRDIKESIDEVFCDLNLPTNYYINEFWYNIYHLNQGQETHNHIPSVNYRSNYWSGIYYNKNASPTRFIRSDLWFKTHLFPNYQKSEISDCYYYTMSPFVDDGDIILFPPYLEHEVPEIKLEDPDMRLTFSFNLVLEQD